MIEAAQTPFELYVGFSVLMIVVMCLDLGIGQKKAHAPTMKESAFWTSIWVAAALIFNAWLWREEGSVKGMEFLTGYIIEYSLSVDNLFVFIMIFSYFGVAPDAQPRVLKWGIIGAVIMRGIFIAAGAALLQRFHWMIYVFGAFLIFTGIKMVMHTDEEIHPDKNIFVRLAKKFLPVCNHFHGMDFVTAAHGGRHFTPLFITLLVVESTDVVFALDSIPAIYGITSDPFIVFTSNIFAIMGLRALFFLLAGALDMFRFLKTGVSVVLVFIGLKMTASGYYHMDIKISLGFVFAILATSVAASLVPAKKKKE